MLGEKGSTDELGRADKLEREGEEEGNRIWRWWW
jgi:hypothetical protein